MDYMTEIASHPDISEALDALAGEWQGARWLLGKVPPPERPGVGFLRDKYPNAWLAEVIHEFYRTPRLAAEVWKELRYCRRFRESLAIRMQPAAGTPWRFGAAKARPDTTRDADVLKRYQDAASPRGDVKTPTRAEVRVLVAQHADAIGYWHDPPQFIAELIKAELAARAGWYRRISEQYWSTMRGSQQVRDRAFELLSNLAEVRRAAEETGIPVPFSMVLQAELQQIRHTRNDVCGTPHGPRMTATLREPVIGEQASEGAPTRQALREDLVGLAFSGGGIRSATFNLGVLQSLAQIGLLKHCDYLSTVSGGGYIGSWFAAWMFRRSREQPASDAIDDMQRRLSPARNPGPLAAAVRPIRFLREYSNYLTPRTGFLSADTWTMLGIFSRNALLNQVILVSLFAAFLLLPRLMLKLTWMGWLSRAVTTYLAVGVVVLLCGVATNLLVANLRRLDPDGTKARAQRPSTMPPKAGPKVPWYARPFWIQVGVVLPWLAAASIVAQVFPWHFSARFDGNVGGPGAAGLAVGLYLGLLLLAGKASRCWEKQGGWYGSLILAAAVSGAATAAILWALRPAIHALGLDSVNALPWHAAALGGPGLLLIFSLAVVVMLGMLGKKFPDEHREWWSRLRSFMHMYAGAWLACFVVALYVPWGWRTVQSAPGNWSGPGGWGALAAWVASTIAGIRAGRQAPPEQAAGSTAASAGSWIGEAVRTIAPYVFVAGLVVAVSLTLDAICYPRTAASGSSPDYWQYVTENTTGRGVLGVFVGCVVVGLLFSWRIDINEFSLHHFYKNRLVRCYLGASHGDARKADWFTGFDPLDDLPLAWFDHEYAQKIRRRSTAAEEIGPPYPGPYPILNGALNLVAGKDLAWQERKAESFVFTPKYCGYDLDRAVLEKSQEGAADAYLPTLNFYHEGEGPMLGTAMAISGAAANPNMGRATSSASAFLLTAFNVRLGWWLGNTRNREKAKLPGPKMGLTYTAKELTGSTDDESHFVNVSDGGHFDNLGVYELIRRGCRYIVACDAGQDQAFTCEDLGDLVRRCRTDFGVEIDISADRIRDRSAGFSRVHCVVGTIHYLNVPRRNWNGQLVNDQGYPIADGDTPGHETGYLIYLKPSITGDEPHDVLEYSTRVREFPHESTADQWFNESQFESYRKLGIHVAERTFSRYQYDDRRPFDPAWLFQRLYKFWYPPSVAVGENSTDHTQVYSAIMERVRQSPGLRFVDHTLFDGLVEDGIKDPRDEFYVVNSLIQLMEDVYADLNLEEAWRHPHVEGWMAVFRRWAVQDAFRRTWAISCSTYAERFRNFYDDRLADVRPGRRSLSFPRCFIAAHRGRVGAATGGNTMADFESAIAAKVEVIELDVRKLGDGTLVVFHDDQAAGSPLRSLSYSTLAPLFSDGVPTLSECLKTLRGRVLLDIELKDEGIERDVLKEIREAAWSPADFVLTSFHTTMPPMVRSLREDVQVGLLIEAKDLPAAALAYKDSTEIDFIAPAADPAGLTNQLLEALATAGMPVVPWTVNDRLRIRELFRNPAVAGIITDQPADARTVRNEIR